MRPTFLFLALTVVRVCMGQPRPDMVQTVPDLRDIYARASASALVVRGHVQDISFVSPNKKRTQTADGKVVESISGSELARLVTVAVDQVLCRRSDFSAAGSERLVQVDAVKMLIPLNELAWKCEFGFSPDCVAEELLDHREYLLFLREDPRSATLSSLYAVAPGVTYYRAVLGFRGASLLPRTGAEWPLLTAVTALCDALQPPDMPSKLARLRALSVTADPRWRGEVDRTIRALEAAQSKPNQ
jgi:hypothetical protein